MSRRSQTAQSTGVTVLVAATALTLLSAMAPTTKDRLADAARRNDVVSVQALLGEGADPSGALGDGMTPLHWTARSGGGELAALLIERGAKLEAVTRVGAHTPLHVASAAGNAEVVAVLAASGADVVATTETGSTALHFAAASGSAAAVATLLEHGANANATEPRWGQTPLMFAAAAGRTEVVGVLLEAGASPAASARVVDVAARNETDQAERRARRERIAALRAAARSNEPAAGNETATGPAPEDARSEEARRKRQQEREEANERGGEPVPLNYAGLVGSHGGLTPLLLAAREGHEETALALLHGGADINQTSAADHTSPMLIATINGHFDLAMALFERGADPTLASDAGATPLFAALNMHWAPKARHPQPVAYRQQKTTYLEMMVALLEAGVDPNRRLEKTLWFTTYNRDLLGVNRAGATPFWRAAHSLDLEAMRLLLRYGADPDVPTIKVPERRRGPKDGEDHSGLPPVPLGGPAVYPIHAASGVGYGQGFAGNSHRHVPDGWLPAVKFLVEELGADVNARDHHGYTPLHHAAARGDNELIHYLVSKGADPTAVSRSGQTTADMANGPVQRVSPFPATVALLESLGSKNNHNCVGC